MHDIKERLSLLWDLRVIELPVCGRACPVLYCWLAKSSPTSPTVGSAGVRSLDGNTHRHDPGVSTASV